MKFKLAMEALVTISRKGDASSSELALETINKILEIEAKEHISSNCTCKAEETTGWTTVKCCNICGKPISGETWSFSSQCANSKKYYLATYTFNPARGTALYPNRSKMYVFDVDRTPLECFEYIKNDLNKDGQVDDEMKAFRCTITDIKPIK